MSTMQQGMTSKDIFLAEKRADGLDYLMKRFSHQFSTEEELFAAIIKIMPTGHDMIKKLKKNKKRAYKQLERRHASASKVCSFEVKDDVLEEEVSAEELDDGIPVIEIEQEQKILGKEVEDAVVVMADEQELSSKGDELQKLQEEELAVRQILCDLEVEHKNLVNERRKIVEKLRKAKRQLEALLKQLGEQQANIAALYDVYEACDVQMSLVNKDKESYYEIQREIKEAISNIKKVTIFVFENGSIEVENADEVSFDEEQVSKELQMLFVKPEAEELTVKELKLIARIRVMVNAFNEQGVILELAFEDEMLQEKYGSFN